MGAPPPEIAVQRLSETLTQVRSAKEVHRYRLGTYRAVVFTEIDAGSIVKIPHAMAVFEHKDKAPVLVLFAEQRLGAEFYGTGSHEMMCLEGGRRERLGDSNAFADVAGFEQRALELAGVRLNVSDAPTRVKPRDPDAPKRKTKRAPIPVEVFDEPEPPSRRSLVPSTPQVKKGFGVLGGLGAALIVLRLVLKLGASGASSGSYTVPPNFNYVPSTPSDKNVLALPGGPADPIALDDANVYWVSHTDATLYARPKVGGEPSVVASDVRNVTGLAVDGDDVYFTFAAARSGSTEAGVRRVAKKGGSPEIFRRSFMRASSPLVHNGVLLCVDGVSVDGLVAGRATFAAYVGIPIDGGAPFEYVTSSEIGASIGANNDFVYWIDLQSGSVEFAPTGGGDASAARRPVFAFEQNDADADDRAFAEIAVDDSSLYVIRVSEYGEHTVERLPKDGRRGTLLASVPAPIDGLTVREGDVWWVQRAAGEDGAVYRVPAKKREPIRVVEGLSTSSRIAVDAKRVYWTVEGEVASAPISSRVGDAGTDGGRDAGGRRVDAGAHKGGEPAERDEP